MSEVMVIVAQISDMIRLPITSSVFFCSKLCRFCIKKRQTFKIDLLASPVGFVEDWGYLMGNHPIHP
jgi:hypothetical protein